MKRYDQWCEELYVLVGQRRNLFLTINTMCFGVVGLVLWYVIHFFCLDRIDWLLCFIGYPAVCVGYIGGIFYFMRRD